jgi:hypothetical protein
MTADNKNALFGFGLALLLFYLLQRSFMKSDSPETNIQPAITDDNINIAITAYQNAINAGEPASVLNDLNTSFVQDYGFRISQRQSDGRFSVTNLSGREVKVV